MSTNYLILKINLVINLFQKTVWKISTRKNLQKKVTFKFILDTKFIN